jgi:hypothetical protein
MARVLQQREEYKNKFYEWLKQKKKTEKEKVMQRVEDHVPSLLSWAIKPIVGVAHDWNQLKKEVKGTVGEKGVHFVAKWKLSDEWVIINDAVLFLTEEKFAQNDHVIIGPPGVFIVETKNWEGAYLAHGDDWKQKQNGRWSKVSSPTKQNTRHAKIFVEWIKKHHELGQVFLQPEKIVIPVVVFTNASWLKVNQPTIPVFDGISTMISYLQAKTPSLLTPSQINHIADHLTYPVIQSEKTFVSSSKAEIACASSTESAVEKKISHYELKKTKNGRKYVHIYGDYTEAKQVYDKFQSQGHSVERLRKDTKRENLYYFYLR